jgi:hypothetical protein
MTTIEQLRDERQQAEAVIKQKGAELYATFSEDERAMMRFGLHPHAKTVAAEKALMAMKAEGAFPMFDDMDLSRLLSVAVMDAANAGPDKMVV